MRFIVLAASLITCCVAAAAPAWGRFRGPNRAGLAKNLLWKLETLPGYSCPVIGGDRLFLTAHEKGELFTLTVQAKI